MDIPDTFGLPQSGLAHRRFDIAAATFDRADAVHAEARTRLLERLDLFKLEPEWIVDLGAATGSASVELGRSYPRARVVAADASFPMARAIDRKRRDLASISPVQCDAHDLPCLDGSIDLIFGNLLLPWVRPDRVFAECARALKPGGLVLLTSFGPDTLVELRRAWSGIDDCVHVHGFVDMHDLGDLALRAGLAEPVMDIDRLTISYSRLNAVIADLRATGCSNSAVGRRTSLTGRHRWRAFEAAFADQTRANGPSVTVELIYAQAWGAGRPTAPRRSTDGEVRIAAEALAQAVRGGRTPGG